MTEPEARDLSAEPSRKRRRDAAENRARLLAAARQRLGPDVTVSSREIERARVAGAVRPDVTVADLLLIFAANAGVTAAGRAAGRGERSRRLADLALTGLGLRPANEFTVPA
jgi:hypothetical protein